ncbi:hypothetical protein J6590_054224 [Homalodisca vitripennis]|nr:hypothetical protein J6590_054224 [Homalodisca vitripennis]
MPAVPCGPGYFSKSEVVKEVAVSLRDAPSRQPCLVVRATLGVAVNLRDTPPRQPCLVVQATLVLSSSKCEVVKEVPVSYRDTPPRQPCLVVRATLGSNGYELCDVTIHVDVEQSRSPMKLSAPLRSHVIGAQVYQEWGFVNNQVFHTAGSTVQVRGHKTRDVEQSRSPMKFWARRCSYVLGAQVYQRWSFSH